MLVVPSITDTVSPSWLVTYRVSVDWSTPTPLGREPTATVPLTASVASSITETLSLIWLAT